MAPTHDEIVHRFTHHPPANEQIIDLHTEVRERAKEFAILINDEVPESREKALALTKLEESVMWANAAIARQMSAEPPLGGNG